jgi:hypothetical protein
MLRSELEDLPYTTSLPSADVHSHWHLKRDGQPTFLLEPRQRIDPVVADSSDKWWRRFVEDNPALRVSHRVTPVETSRQHFEKYGASELKQFFDWYRQLRVEKELSASDVWNMDETGIRFGIIGSNLRVIVSAVKPRDKVDICPLFASLFTYLTLHLGRYHELQQPRDCDAYNRC